MKILCVADNIDPLVDSERIKERFHDVNFVLGCGDLQLSYYEFIINHLNKPLYFIFGNHHLSKMGFYRNRSLWEVPLASQMDDSHFYGIGATYVDGKCVKQDNLLILGLGGSIRYNNGDNQFTDMGMYLRIWRLIPRLIFNKIRYGRYLDILITHAPPFEIHDKKDRCHRGFKAFRWFMKKFKPKYLIHGHIHLYCKTKNRVSQFHETQVINAYDHYILEIEDKK